MFYDAPRVLIAGLSGGSGKTLVSLGLARAFARQGLKVAGFKKGPDYIDTALLGLAAAPGNPLAAGRNLDSFLAAPERFPGKLQALLLRPFQGQEPAGLAIIEGNRGLFDGMNLQGSHSSAELARLLGTPLILVINASKMTRTAAALVKGCKEFEPGLNLAGVIVNRATRPRHRALIKESIENLTGVPVLALLPRLSPPPLVERQTGLVLEQQGGSFGPEIEENINRIADLLEEHADLAAILAIARSAPPLSDPPLSDYANCLPNNLEETPAKLQAKNGLPLVYHDKPGPQQVQPAPLIGYARDAAFPYGYIENLEALENAGGRLTPVSLLDPAPWPRLDGLYLGGGFVPEYVPALAASIQLPRLHDLVEKGLPVYAEYGGLVLLCKSALWEGKEYKMGGLWPLAAEFCRNPKGLGYVEGTVRRANPYYTLGRELRAHEFHYVRFETTGAACPELARAACLALHKGHGLGMPASLPDDAAGATGLDGLLHKNTFASMLHVFAPGCPDWAFNFVRLCVREDENTAA